MEDKLKRLKERLDVNDHVAKIAKASIKKPFDQMTELEIDRIQQTLDNLDALTE